MIRRGRKIWVGFLLLTGIWVQMSVGAVPTFRNQLGEIIPVNDWGQAGVDFKDSELIASFKHAYFSLPPGQTEADLKNCSVDSVLNSILEQHKVYHVKQVFTGVQPGDTLEIVGSDTIRVPDLSRTYLLLQSTAGDVLNTVFDLYTLDATFFAEPNYYLFPDTDPNDEHWGDQWNLETHDPGNDAFGIGCPEAWPSTTGDPSVKLAIIDAGVDYNHTDLGGPDGGPPNWNSKIAGGWDYYYNDEDPYHPNCDHGTAVAGIIGALTNNQSFIAGIAGGWADVPPNNTGVTLYTLNIYEGDQCEDAPDGAVAAAIRDAADPDEFDCKVLNNSYGKYIDPPPQVLTEAVNYAYDVGASFVASMGNDDQNNDNDPHYPSDFEEQWVTAVGAHFDGYRIWGGGHGSNYGANIDLMAPSIVWTIKNGNDNYVGFGGTSAATAHVSGSIALIRSLLPDLTNEDTDWILKFSAWDPPLDWDPYPIGDPPQTDGDEWTWDKYYGHGELRISKAVRRIYVPGMISMWDLIPGTASGNVTAEYITSGDWTFDGEYLQGEYPADLWLVDVPVTYGPRFSEIPYVWGVGRGSQGWSGGNIQYENGFAWVVPGSQSLTGCTLRTFVYYVYGPDDWYPCHYNDVELQYKLWGAPLLKTPNGPEGGKPSSGETAPELTLGASSPNPFNSITTIKFGLPERCPVQVTIYDLLGRETNTLITEVLPAGYHDVEWDGTNQNGMAVPSGVYFVRLEAGAKHLVQKTTLLK